MTIPIEHCNYSQVVFRVAYRVIERRYRLDRELFAGSAYDAICAIKSECEGMGGLSGALSVYASYSLLGWQASMIRDYVCGDAVMPVRNRR